MQYIGTIQRCLKCGERYFAPQFRLKENPNLLAFYCRDCAQALLTNDMRVLLGEVSEK